MASTDDQPALEPRRAQTQLNTLWDQHAADPGRQALLCARFCLQHAPHLTARLKARILASLPDALFAQLLFRQPNDGRIQALSLLAQPVADTPAPPQPLTRPQAPDSPRRLLDQPSYQAIFGVAPQVVDLTPLRSDPELGRLAIALHLAPQYRLWVVARQISREAGGSGCIDRAELKSRLAGYDIRYSDRQLRRLLAGGAGVFWRPDGQQLYLTGWQRLGVLLVELAEAHGCEVGFNRPGARQQLVAVAGSLEGWEARLYASWIAYRDGLSISRDRQAALFGRCRKTIRLWEEQHLAGVVTRRFDYEQHPDDARTPEELYDLRGHVPDHARGYTVRGAQRRYWQRVNTYTARVEAHPHGGQARKVRRAVNGAISADTDGGPWRRYYTLEAHQKRLRSRRFRHGEDGDVNAPVSVFIGQHRRRGVWELMLSDPACPYPLTRATERR